MATQSKSIVVNFTGGEVDSYTLGLVNLDVHAHTAERMENLFIVEQGAMELAPGTKFLRATPSNGFSIVRPWVFSIENAFCLEFSDELVRFISGDGYVELTGADATVADFTDESAVTPTGGGTAPSGGGGSGVTQPDGRTDCVWFEAGGYWICPEDISIDVGAF